MRNREPSWIVHPPDPRIRDRWWLVLLVIVSGPAVALVLHLLGV